MPKIRFVKQSTSTTDILIGTPSRCRRHGQIIRRESGFSGYVILDGEKMKTGAWGSVAEIQGYVRLLLAEKRAQSNSAVQARRVAYRNEHIKKMVNDPEYRRRVETDRKDLVEINQIIKSAGC